METGYLLIFLRYTTLRAIDKCLIFDILCKFFPVHDLIRKHFIDISSLIGTIVDFLFFYQIRESIYDPLLSNLFYGTCNATN